MPSRPSPRYRETPSQQAAQSCHRAAAPGARGAGFGPCTAWGPRCRAAQPGAEVEAVGGCVSGCERPGSDLSWLPQKGPVSPSTCNVATASGAPRELNFWRVGAQSLLQTEMGYLQ